MSSVSRSICLFGASLDVGNMGCRALAVSLIKLFIDRYPDARIKLLYGNHKPVTHSITINNDRVEVDVVNFRLSPRANIHEHIVFIAVLSVCYRLFPFLRGMIAKKNRFINTLIHADFIGDIRGGDSFSDIYGINRLFWGSVPLMIVKLLKKQYTLLPQTYGPYNAKSARIMARLTVKNARYICARDHYSVDVIKNVLKITDREIIFCPDVAFTLPAKKPTWYNNPRKKQTNTLVGFNISGLLYHGGYTQNNMFSLQLDYPKFPKLLIESLLDDPNTEVLLVPHVLSTGVEDDVTTAKTVYSGLSKELQNRVHIIDNNADQSELKYCIGQCDFFIGSRMHSCIAALSQGIPTIGVAYSDKFKGVFKSVGYEEDVIDARIYNEQEIVNMCINRITDQDSGQHKLNEEITALIRHTIESF